MKSELQVGRAPYIDTRDITSPIFKLVKIHFIGNDIPSLNKSVVYFASCRKFRAYDTFVQTVSTSFPNVFRC